MAWVRWSRQSILKRRIAVLGLVATCLIVGSGFYSYLSPVEYLVSVPSNTTFPLQLVSYPDLKISPLTIIDSTLSLFPTHLIRHPKARNVFLATNEVRKGTIVALRRTRDILEVAGTPGSGGSYPAYCTTVTDRLLCSNYDSPSISLHRLVRKWPYIHHHSTYSFLIGEEDDSHPHQIVLHPQLKEIFYVPDLGMNGVHMMKLDSRGMELVQTYFISSEQGEGARHAVITPDGANMILGFQTSSTVSSIPIDPQGYLQPFDISHPTLPSALQNRTSSHALSDVHSHRDTIYILNRQVLPPYSGEGDSIAMFKNRAGHLHPSGHIQLPCFQPREIKRVDEKTMLVTCVGGDGKGAGIVLIKDHHVVGYEPGMSMWGVEAT